MIVSTGEVPNEDGIDGPSGNLECLPVPVGHVRSAQRLHREFVAQGARGSVREEQHGVRRRRQGRLPPSWRGDDREQREKKEAFGEKRDYLVLRLAYGDLTLMVPADNAEEIGLRVDVINDEEVEEVFAVLRKKEARMPTNWSRRFKNHVEKLKSGDIYQVVPKWCGNPLDP